MKNYEDQKLSKYEGGLNEMSIACVARESKNGKSILNVIAFFNLE